MEDRVYADLIELVRKFVGKGFEACAADIKELVEADVLVLPAIPVLFEMAIADQIRDFQGIYETPEEALEALRNKDGYN